MRVRTGLVGRRGLTTLVLVIGMASVGCDDGGTSSVVPPFTPQPDTTLPTTDATGDIGSELDAVEPDAAGPDTTAPDATEADTTAPDATEPDAAEPDTTEPDATEPDTTEPDTTEPDATEPDTTEPDAAEPDTTEPDATEPDTTEPDATEPDAADPDTSGPDVGEPDVTEPDSGPDVILCCTEAECAANGLACDPVSCECVDTGQCQEEYGACDPSEPQPAPFICLEGSTGEGSCYTPCNVADPVTCDEDAYCATVADADTTGYCMPSTCDSFWGDPCGAAGTCDLNDVIGSQLVWTCVLAGDGAADAACDVTGDCQAGLLCVGNACQAMGCAPLTGAAACDDGSVCDALNIGGIPLDLGICEETCTPYVPSADDGCDAGTWCQGQYQTASGEWVAACVASGGGLAGPGQTCLPEGGAPATTCQDGLLCLNDGTVTSCYVECDVSDPFGCGPGDGCFGFPQQADDGSYTAVTPFGYCDAACLAFDPEPGCAPGEVCGPSTFAPYAGICQTPVGGAGLGAPCDGSGMTATTCVTGTFCDAGVCRAFCHVDAEPSAYGSCPDGQGCSVLSLPNPDGTSFALDLGFCGDSCGYHEGDLCPAPADLCMPGEPYNQPFDVCFADALSDDWFGLAEFQPCPAGAAEGSACKPGGFCLELPELGGDGLRCYEACMTTEGPIGSTGHPDCTRTEAVCEDYFSNWQFGLCGAAAAE